MPFPIEVFVQFKNYFTVLLLRPNGIKQMINLNVGGLLGLRLELTLEHNHGALETILLKMVCCAVRWPSGKLFHLILAKCSCFGLQ